MSFDAITQLKEQIRRLEDEIMINEIFVESNEDELAPLELRDYNNHLADLRSALRETEDELLELIEKEENEPD